MHVRHRIPSTTSEPQKYRLCCDFVYKCRNNSHGWSAQGKIVLDDVEILSLCSWKLEVKSLYHVAKQEVDLGPGKASSKIISLRPSCGGSSRFDDLLHPNTIALAFPKRHKGPTSQLPRAGIHESIGIEPFGLRIFFFILME